MKLERSILIAFLGNYLINTIAAALVSLIPSGGATGIASPQYISFIVLAVLVVAVLAWWRAVRGWKEGLIFGIVGFLTAIVTVFLSGIAGVLGQTGSLSQMVAILPNFGAFLVSLSTLFLIGYWIIPPIIVGWFKGHDMPAPTSM